MIFPVCRQARWQRTGGGRLSRRQRHPRGRRGRGQERGHHHRQRGGQLAAASSAAPAARPAYIASAGTAVVLSPPPSPRPHPFLSHPRSTAPSLETTAMFFLPCPGEKQRREQGVRVLCDPTHDTPDLSDCRAIPVLVITRHSCPHTRVHLAPLSHESSASFQ